MAAKQAQSIGVNCLKPAVSSVMSIMPVTGARTTAAKNAAMPITAKAVEGATKCGKTD